jgi:hypothetical protein
MDMSSSKLVAGLADPVPIACGAALAPFELVRFALVVFAPVSFDPVSFDPVSFVLGGFANPHAP